MAPSPAVVLLRHHLEVQGHVLPNEVWNAITDYAVTKAKPVPSWLLPATYKQAIAPFKRTEFEIQAKATFWKTIAVRHAQSVTTMRGGSEIETSHPSLGPKIENLIIASHAMTMSRHITDVMETIEGCPNIKTLIIEVTIPDANPYFFHAALDTARSIMRSIVGADVKKTVVLLLEPRVIPLWSEVVTRQLGVASEWITNSGVDVKVINLPSVPATWDLRFGRDN